jgi:hypothetical protein
MAKTKKVRINVTAFQILEALTGESPCHASPAPAAKEPAKKKTTAKGMPEKNPAAVRKNEPKTAREQPKSGGDQVSG